MKHVSRIYRVKHVSGNVALVRAESKSRALAHVVAEEFEVTIASQDQIVEFISNGLKVVEATKAQE
jgi:c-di-GMP-binding flagellar brake protein YcgR